MHQFFGIIEFLISHTVDVAPFNCLRKDGTVCLCLTFTGAKLNKAIWQREELTEGMKEVEEYAIRIMYTTGKVTAVLAVHIIL